MNRDGTGELLKNGWESINIPQTRRQDSNTTSARPAVRMRLPDGCSRVRVCSHAGLVSYRSRASLRTSDRSSDEPSVNRSSRILRIRGVAVVSLTQLHRDENSLGWTLET
jgi:hypothetical protein